MAILQLSLPPTQGRQSQVGGMCSCRREGPSSSRHKLCLPRQGVSFMAPQEGQRDRAGDRMSPRTTVTSLYTVAGLDADVRRG